VNFYFSLHCTDESLIAVRVNRQDFGDWPAMFRYDDALRIEIIQNRQAFCFELRRRYGLLFDHGPILSSDQSSDQFISRRGPVGFKGFFELH
jgi:hypothetical protein